MVNHWSVLAVALALGLFLPGIGATPHAQADVVEGHTTHVELLVEEQLPREFSIIGDVRCHFEVNRIRVAVPPGFASAVVDCLADTHILAHEDGSPDPRSHSLAPTGWQATVTDANGVPWTVTEYEYWAVDPDTREPTRHYAWGVPASGPYEDPDTGASYSFMVVPNPAHVDGGVFRAVAGNAPGA